MAGLIITLAMVVAAFGLAACGPGTAPAGQSPMAVLSRPAGLDSFREQFNKAADRIRVIVLLSPT